jgi:hypothetical protein
LPEKIWGGIKDPYIPDVIIFNIAHQIANIFYFTLTYPPFFILNRAKYNPEQ